MNLFRRRQEPDAALLNRLDALERQAARIESEMRQYQTEQVTMHDQVRKWMRRAIAAERHQDRLVGGVSDGPAAPATETPEPPQPWGARGRRVARQNGGS